MANAIRTLGKVLETLLERIVRFLVAIPINLVTIPLGLALFTTGALVSFLTYDSGSAIRVEGINIVAWGWDWWPAELDVDWKV